MEDYTKIKQILTEVLATHDEANKERFKNVNEKLERIDNHLATLNGKVAKHEQTLNSMLSDNRVHNQANEDYIKNRSYTCPNLHRIETLEKDKGVRIGVKQTIIGSISLIGVMFSIALGAVKLAENYGEKQSNQQTKEIVKEILIELKNEDFYY